MHISATCVHKIYFREIKIKMNKFRQTSRESSRHPGRKTFTHMCGQTDRQTYIHTTERQTDSQTDRQADKQTHSHPKDRQTDRQTYNRQTIG